MKKTYDLYDLNKNKKDIKEILYLTDTYNIYSNFYGHIAIMDVFDTFCDYIK